MGHLLPAASLDAIAAHLQPHVHLLDAPSAARFFWTCSVCRHCPPAFLSAYCDLTTNKLRKDRKNSPAGGDVEKQGEFLSAVAFALGSLGCSEQRRLLELAEDAALRRPGLFTGMQLAGE